MMKHILREAGADTAGAGAPDSRSSRATATRADTEVRATSARRPRVLFLTKYNEMGASSRYRVYRYLPYLESQGVTCTIRPFFPDRYLERIYGDGGRGRQLHRLLGQIARWQAQRWMVLNREAQKHDAVFLQYESMPYVPAFLEKTLFQRNPRVVVDYDDAIYVTYEQHPNPAVRRLLGSKIHWIVGHSRHVIAGNSHLASWARAHNPNVTVIPTSVDLGKYPADLPPQVDTAKPVIGWIGTPVTARYLRMLERPLRALRARHDFVLKVIGAPGFTMDGIDVSCVPWSEEAEVQELRSCQVGIMPIPDDPWERGKSALKLIQYMAAGVPAVASPVGANCDVVRHGRNGLLARSEEDWTEQLSVLIEQPECRRRLACAGRQTVEARYSLQANAPLLADVLLRVASS